MVPAALIAPCLVWWNDWSMSGGVYADLAIIPAVLLVILFVAACVNLYLYLQDHNSDIFANVQAARNSTPEVRMFEAAKGMHPEAVKALLVHRRTIWRVKYIPLKDVVDWVLDEAPNVHAGFVDFVLDHSNGSIMPKRFLSDGSRQYDPDGLVTDYEQYDALIHLMQSKLMITQAFGNQAPQLLPPWTAELLRHRFGLDGGGYGVEEAMSEAMKAVVRAQSKAEAGSGVVRGDAYHLPNVIEKALEGLEQTAEMKARMHGS
jgi:hypothetical protein